MQLSTKEVRNLLVKKHVFDAHQVVKKNNIVFGTDFVDCPQIYSHVSTEILQSIAEIQSGSITVKGITISAEAGSGKSHLIARLRERVHNDDSALFVYVGGVEDLENLQYEVSRKITASLKRCNKDGIIHAKLFACHLVANSIKNRYSVTQILNQLLPHVFSKKGYREAIESIYPHLEKNYINHDPYILRAICWLLVDRYIPYALKFLSGDGLADAEAQEIGVPPEGSGQSASSLRDLIDLIGEYRVPLICFDELDVFENNDVGYTRAQLIANLVKELVNNIKKGLILTALFPKTLQEEIFNMPDANAVLERMAVNSDPIVLTGLKADEVYALVATRLESFARRENIELPHPVFPFDENEIKQLGDNRPFPRRVLSWCSQKLQGQSEDRVSKIDRINLSFLEEMKSLDEEELENNELLTKALIFGFQGLVGQVVENVEIEEVDYPVLPKNQYIGFRIIGREKGKKVQIGVCVLQQSHTLSIKAALKHLGNYQKYKLTRGCFIRSKTLPKASSVQNLYSRLIDEQGGEWAPLKFEEIAPLIAILSIWQSKENLGISEQDISQFIQEKQAEYSLGQQNIILREVLSDPSGQAPDDLKDEEEIFQKTIEFEAFPSADQAFSEGLEDLFEGNDREIDYTALSGTQAETLSLHLEGKNIEEIATERSLSVNTVVNHLVNLITLKQPVELTRLVAKNRIRKIVNAIRSSDSDQLRAIRDNLDEGYTYNEIKLVKAAYDCGILAYD